MHSKDSKTQPSKPKLFNIFFLLLTFASFFAFISGQGAAAGFAVYVDINGGSASYSGFLVLVFSLAAALSRLIVGAVLDRSFAIKAAFIGMTGLAVFTFLAYFFPQPGLPMVVLRALQGFSFAYGTTACAFAVEEVLPEERLGEGIGYYGLAQALALALGPAFGLMLVQSDASTNLFIGLTIAALFAIVAIALCRYDKHPDKLPTTAAYLKKLRVKQCNTRDASPSCDGLQVTKETGRVSKTNSNCKNVAPLDISSSKITQDYHGLAKMFEIRALPGALGAFLFCTTHAFFIMFSAQYGYTLQLEYPSLLFILASVSMFTVRAFSGSYMDTIDSRKLMTFALLLGAVGMTLFNAAQQIPFLFYVAGVVHGAAFGIVSPLSQTVCVKSCPHERWGAATGLYYLGVDFGLGIGGIAIGVIIDTVGYSIIFVCALIMYALLFAVAWLFFPKPQINSQKERFEKARTQ